MKIINCGNAEHYNCKTVCNEFFTDVLSIIAQIGVYARIPTNIYA